MESKYTTPETINDLLTQFKSIKGQIHKETVYNPLILDDDVRVYAARAASEYREMLAAADTKRARMYGEVCKTIAYDMEHLIKALEASNYTIGSHIMDALLKLYQKTINMEGLLMTYTFVVDEGWKKIDDTPDNEE